MVQYPFVYDEDEHAPLSVTAPDLEKKVGDSVPSGYDGWTEGITADWPYNNYGTIDSSHTGNPGSITDNTTKQGNNPFINEGLVGAGKFTGIGVREFSYYAAEGVGGDAGTEWGYSDEAIRNIKVTTDLSPAISAKYGAGVTGYTDYYGTHNAGDAYSPGNWTNKPLDITVSPNPAGLKGFYGSALYRGASQLGAGGNTGNGFVYTYPNYNIATGAGGQDLTGRLIADASPYDPLSGDAALNVKIDLTNPIPGATYDAEAGVFTDTSTDLVSGVELSGIWAEQSKIALVDKDAAAPAESAYVPFSELSVSKSGLFDVYVLAMDKAGNKAMSKVISALELETDEAPLLSVKIANGETGAGDTVVSDKWVNRSVTARVYCPTPEIVSDATIHYNALYQYVSGSDILLAQGIASLGGAPTHADGSAAVKTFADETTGIVLRGRILNASGNPLSAFTPDFTLKIDKTKPVPGLSYNGATFVFTDASADDQSPAGANSGVDGTLTRIAYVAPGTAAPGAADWKVLGGSGNNLLPATGNYDVWAEATDVAGNTTAAKIYKNLNRSGKDAIDAKDAYWGLNQAGPILASGDAAFAAAVKALAEAAGAYYGADSIPAADLIITPASLAALKAAVDAGTKGAVSVTFQTPYRAEYPNAQASKTVTIKLFDEGGDPEESIYANDFIYGIGSGQIGEAQAKAYAKAAAFDADGTAIDAGDILITAAQLAAINTAISNKGKSGNPYPLTFSTKGQTGAAASVTIDVTLYDEGSNGETAIAANNFSYGCDEPTFTGAIAKELSRAIATDGDGNAQPLADITANPADIGIIETARAAGQTGVYSLTFTEPIGGKAATIKVTLTDKGNGDEERITANHFSYGVGEASLTADIARHLSGVLATDAN
ncbi:MAG: hypothetical protein LBS91_09070, partial [Clostridiales Family XIII bacterium]|nr:hypothetical protein [Clostridiales Family XIII bacterium]